MGEIWKVYYNGPRVKWEVSNEGNVKKNGVPYECKLNIHGYKVFGCGSLHRAVAMLFIPNPENKPCVDHINVNKLDNRAINLQWCTYKENSNNPITLKHLSEGNKGKNTGPQSAEHRRKNSEAHKGRKLGPQSEEHRKHLAEVHLNTHRVYREDGTWYMDKNL